ncbi:hypothetical protein Tco_0930295, partial [Tanacetum coccineum]
MNHIFKLNRTGSLYQKIYWELLPKEILGATTQRDIRSYYPKRYWELLPKELLGDITQRETGMSYWKMEEVTRRYLEALELKGGNGGACKGAGGMPRYRLDILGCLHDVNIDGIGIGNIPYNMKEYHNPSIYKIRRFEMMKYSFDVDDEYVAIKEREHSRADIDACQVYQELFCIMDEG